MENGLFSSSEFTQWSEKYVAYLHVSTRLEDRKHEGLFREMGFTGFPTLAFLDADGQLTAKHAGQRAIDALQQTAAKSAAYLAMRAKAAEGDRAAAQHVFLADLELMRYSFAKGSLVYATMREGMSPQLQEKAQQRLIDVQYGELRRELSKQLQAGLDREEYSRLYAELSVDFFKAGRIPGGSNAVGVLMSVMRTARQANDVALYASALAKFKTTVANQPRYARSIEQHERQLAELRGDK